MINSFILVVCLASTPQTCQNFTVPFDSPRNTISTCLRDAPIKADAWLKATHPKYRAHKWLKKVRCKQ